MRISTNSILGMLALSCVALVKNALAVTCEITFTYPDGKTCTASVECPSSVTSANCTVTNGGVCQGWQTHLSGSSYACYASCSGSKSDESDSGSYGSGFSELDKTCGNNSSHFSSSDF